MSFRKFNSFTKNEKKSGSSIRPFDLFLKLFTRNSNLHKRNESFSYSNKSTTKSEIDFIWNLELVIIYTASLIRQKIDSLNRVNLIQQFLQCAKFMETHLNESQLFVDNLNPNSPIVQNIKESLKCLKDTHEGFSSWIDNIVQTNEEFDVNIGQDLFFNIEVKAQIFIDKLKLSLIDIDKEHKRSSIDNGSLMSVALKSFDSDTNSRKSCFNDEDRKLIDKLNKLDKNCDLPPPKPAPIFDPISLDSYLSEVEQAVKGLKDYEYDYPTVYKNPVLKSLKIENNCIMASSMISNDIPSVDMDGIEDFTPTPISSSMKNEFHFISTDNTIDNNDIITKVLNNEKSRNFPLPPVPGGDKRIAGRYKLPQMLFPSDEIHFKKKSFFDIDKSQVINGPIANFNNRSPLRSPSLVSSINFQNNKSPVSRLSVLQSDCHSNNFIELSPSTLPFNNINEGANFHSFNNSRQLLMAKQIPSIVDDPNDLLNINDMQDDIEIITRSFDAFNVDGRMSSRLSEISNQTNISVQSEPQHMTSNSLISSNNDETYCNSEVKSDTEEYFEYFEIDGKKYRRKMKKRIVIEKIKIRKTILAPMKSDGTGPDLSNLKDNDDVKEFTDCVAIKKDLDNVEDEDDDDNNNNNNNNNEMSKVCLQPPRFRRGVEDRFRVSKSMFYPYRDQIKRATLCHPPNSKTDENNKLFPLMNKYMYKFGESNCEEPVIDKRFSTQLTDAVYSTWFKTSESSLPHEKSKSICYLKKSRQKNDDGATIHNAVRVTASRTIRMKIPDNVNQNLSITQNTNQTNLLFDNKDDNDIIVNEEDSDTSTCGTDTRRSQYDSLLMSSDDDKEDDENGDNSFQSDSITSEPEAIQSNRSTLDDPELHDLNLAESLDSIKIPSQRSTSSDSCFYSHNSFISESIKDQYSFILKENNATQYLVFDEEPKFGECDIAGGPVDALIVYACDGKEHLLFLGAFLDTYRTFIESEELINRLIFRYKYFRNKIISNDFNNITNEDQTENSDDDPDKKCKHVLSLLLTIIGKLKRDLTDSVSELIQDFQNYLIDINENQWVDAISRTIKTQKINMEKDDKIVQRLLQLSNQPTIPVDLKSPNKEYGSPSKNILGFNNNNKPTIFSFSSRELAEQMTLVDWSKYRDVELMEILNLKDIVKCNLSGVIEYAKNFENVQYWTQSILLDNDRLSDRDRMCLKFFRIMKHLQRLNNFSSFIAILLAIQLLPAKKMFSKRIRSKIKEYENYMKPPRFSGYKEDLKQAVSPCIPFLGIFYQDIVMLNIANPPYLDMEDIIKNADKSNFSSNNNQLLLSQASICGRIINFWRSFKQYIFLKNCNKDQDKIRYSIEPNEKILQFLNNFKDVYDEASIQRSIKQLT